MSGADLQVVGYLSLDEIVCPSGHFIDVPGGAAFYAAAAAAVAGAQVSLVARIGRDFPVAALDALRALGVGLEEAVRDDGPARRSRMHDPTGRGRALPHHDELAWWEATERLTPPVPERPAAVRLFTAMPAAALERQLGAVPPGTITVADTSTGYARREPAAIMALLASLTCFAPSREETRLLLPGADDDAAVAALARQVPLVIQKRGADGVVLRRGERSLFEPSRAKVVLDTTGAGDSLIGAVAAGLARGAADAELLRCGVRIAARTVGGVGAANLLADERLAPKPDKQTAAEETRRS